MSYKAALPSSEKPVPAPRSSHPSLFSLQWQREAGFLDLDIRICGDDVPGRWARVGQRASPREKTSEPFVRRRLEPDTRYPLDFFLYIYFFGSGLVLISYNFISLPPLQRHIDGFQSTNTGGSSQVLVSFRHQIFFSSREGRWTTRRLGCRSPCPFPSALGWFLSRVALGFDHLCSVED